MRYYFLFVFSLLGFILATPCGLACAEGNSLQIVFVNWEPYGFLKDGKPAGFEIDTFAAVIKRMNIKAEFLERPWNRCLYMVENGSADAVISALKTAERQEYMYYPEEFISISETALFVKNDSNISFNGSFGDIKEYVIGVTDGFSYGPAFDQADFLKKDKNTNQEGIVTKVLMGRIDIGIGNIAVINSVILHKYSVNAVRFLRPLIHSRKLYVGFSKARVKPEFVESFSKELTAFKKTKEFRDILARYGVPVYSQTNENP